MRRLMGKSHIGLVYSQEINEELDKLANIVSLKTLLYLNLLSIRKKKTRTINP